MMSRVKWNRNNRELAAGKKSDHGQAEIKTTAVQLKLRVRPAGALGKKVSLCQRFSAPAQGDKQ